MLFTIFSKRSFFVLCGSNFDLLFTLDYAIMVLATPHSVLFLRVVFRLTTYLTIDSSGAHGNKGYKTAEEDLLWNGNGYKKPFVADSRISALFGMWMSRVRVTSLRPHHLKNRPRFCRGRFLQMGNGFGLRLRLALSSFPP